MIDFTKPVQTRDGRKVRILCTDGNDKRWSVIGLIENIKFPAYWDKDGYCSYGRSDGKCDFDLVNVPETRTTWVQVVEYPGKSIGAIAYDSEDSAKKCFSQWNGRKLLAIVSLTFTVGEGLKESK